MSCSSVDEANDRIGIKLAPFTPSGDGVLTHAMDLLRLTKHDVLLDLGCGDARMLVYTAETIGTRCIGVEYDKTLVRKAELRVEEHGVQNLVQIIHADALTFDLESSPVTAIFMYLVPQGIKLLLPKLEEARARGIRIVTYVFSVPGWEWVDIRDYKGTKVYLYNSK